jgi:hypothetical protein
MAKAKSNPVRRAPAVRAPRLPKSLHSQLGPVTVEVVHKLKVNDEQVFGHFSGWNRLIRVNAAPDALMRIQSLYHEWMHMVLFDAGLHNAFTKEQQEMLCDVVGTARAVEVMGQSKRRTK